MATPSAGAAAIAPAPRRARFNLEVRQHVPGWQQALILVGAGALGLAVSAAILVSLGVEARALLDEFVVQTLFNPRSLRSVLAQSAPLILAGLAGAAAFRVRFWNLGIEGQMIFGALGATAVSILQIGPEPGRLWFMLACGLAGGLAWAVLPLALKLRLGVNEIISTLLLNYVASNFLFHLLFGAWRDPGDSFPRSPVLRPAERLGEAFLVNGAVVLALVVAAAAWWLAQRSRLGLYTRVIHANDRMALAVGVPVTAVTAGAVLLGGALAGAAGFAVVAGREGRLTQGFYEGYGFSGILIAFLARNHPLAIVAVAFLFALLLDAGRTLQVLYQVPFAMVQLIEAIVVMFVAASEFFIRHRVRLVR